MFDNFVPQVWSKQDIRDKTLVPFPCLQFQVLSTHIIPVGRLNNVKPRLIVGSPSPSDR